MLFNRRATSSTSSRRTKPSKQAVSACVETFEPRQMLSGATADVDPWVDGGDPAETAGNGFQWTVQLTEAMTAQLGSARKLANFLRNVEAPLRVVRGLGQPGLVLLENVAGDIADSDEFLDRNSQHIVSLQRGAVPTDPRFNEQWGLSNDDDYDVDAPEAWSITTGSPDVIVAVIDNGIDITHPEIQHSLWLPNGEWVVKQDGFHGTAIIGAISGAQNNDLGGSGIAPGVTILPFDRHQPGVTVLSSLEEIYRLRKEGHEIRIVNLSQNLTGASDEEFAAIVEAIRRLGEDFGEHGTLVVKTAGNAGTDFDDGPNRQLGSFGLSNLITVTSSAQDGTLPAVRSSYGRSVVDLTAPFASVLPVPPGVESTDGFRYGGGASVATAIVSGAASLVLSVAPSLTMEQLKSAILDNVDYQPTADRPTATDGRLNAYSALRSVVDGQADNFRINGRTSTAGAFPASYSLLTNGEPVGQNNGEIHWSVIDEDGRVIRRGTGEIFQLATHQRGIFRIEARDAAGEFLASQNVTVSSAVLIPFSRIPGQSVLVVAGTPDHDSIHIVDNGQTVEVRIENSAGVEVIEFNRSEILRVIVHGFRGHDDIHIESATLPATIFGGVGHDSLYGGGADDRIAGGPGHDVLVGGAGNDQIDGQAGHDSLTGGPGNDFLRGGAGRDVFVETLTDDGSLVATGHILNGSLGRDILIRIESLYITGDAGDNLIDVSMTSLPAVLLGRGGNDTLVGSSESDLIRGGTGADLIFGHGGNDRLDGGFQNDRIYGGAGNDVIRGNDGDDQLNGGDGQDSLDGGAGNDTLVGNAEQDELTGGAGSDLFVGEPSEYLDFYDEDIEAVIVSIHTWIDAV